MIYFFYFVISINHNKNDNNNINTPMYNKLSSFVIIIPNLFILLSLLLIEKNIDKSLIKFI